MLKFAVVLFFVAAVTAVPTAPVDPRIELNGDWRVVGGSNAPAGAYPFIVSLRSSGNAHFCGGSVLNGLNILTAAHCVVGRTIGNTITVAGTNTLNAGGTSRATARLLIHANYNPSTIANDIAVVRMSTNLGMTNLIQQTSLNTANTGAVAAILIGWGRTCTTCGLPNNLQHLATNTITHAACVSSWGSLVAQSQICAVIGAGRGACNGDSGGPLIQNGLRSLTVEVGRLSGGQGLLSDSSKEKSKLQEIDKKIDSNFESLMLAQNLFMENCYRLQKDEPQLETKISEVLNEMINTFKAKTAVAPKDIRRLEQALKTHDASMRNGFKNLDTILQKSQLTDLNIQESLNSLYSIKANLIRLNTIITTNSTEISRLGDRLQEVIQLFKNLQTDTSPSNLLEIKLNEIAEKLENLTQTSDEETVLNYVRDHVENMGKIIEDIGNKTERINFIFTDHYKQHLQLFLDEYAEDYLRRITELFNGSQNFDNGIKQMTNSTIEAIKRECFVKDKPDCLEGILDEGQRKAVKIYCIFNTSLTEKDCLKKLINTSESLPEESHSIILENCLKFGANLTNFNCLNGVMKEAEIELIKTYCGLFFRAENDPQGACLRNITKLKIRTDFDRDTLEKIESNCFPSLDIRSGGNFQCLTRIFSNELVQDIRNYCQFHGYDSEENCLRKITNLEDPNVTAAKQLLESNCLLIDVKVARNLSILDCARKILDEDSILALKNYCSARMDLEDCLRSIIGVEKHITAEIKEVIKRNCFPDFDIRTTTKFACISQVVSEDNIRIIEDYCSAKLFLDETDCLRSVISKDNSIKFDIRKRESDAADIATITTEEADYFQPTEATERAEYEDYNLRSY